MHCCSYFNNDDVVWFIVSMGIVFCSATMSGVTAYIMSSEAFDESMAAEDEGLSRAECLAAATSPKTAPLSSGARCLLCVTAFLCGLFGLGPLLAVFFFVCADDDVILGKQDKTQPLAVTAIWFLLLSSSDLVRMAGASAVGTPPAQGTCKLLMSVFTCYMSAAYFVRFGVRSQRPLSNLCRRQVHPTCTWQLTACVFVQMLLSSYVSRCCSWQPVP